MNEILERVQKMRDRAAANPIGDCFLEDGTQFHSKAQDVEMLQLYDEIIANLKSQVEKASDDPLGPQS